MARFAFTVLQRGTQRSHRGTPGQRRAGRNPGKPALPEHQRQADSAFRCRRRPGGNRRSGSDAAARHGQKLRYFASHEPNSTVTSSPAPQLYWGKEHGSASHRHNATPSLSRTHWPPAGTCGLSTGSTPMPPNGSAPSQYDRSFSHPVPHRLTVCVLNDGRAAVIPGDEKVLTSLGRAMKTDTVP